jgi:RimJ/RimL family protein N-acetyltransferase
MGDPEPPDPGSAVIAPRPRRASRSRSPEIAELRGNLVRLRPFAPEEADDTWRGLSLQDEAAHPRRSKEDWSPTPSQRFRERLGRSGRLWRGCLDVAIERRGRLVGLIGARTTPQRCLPAGVFEIGIVLFLPKDRGKGYGQEAVGLMTRWLFDVAGAARVQAGTDARNGAMRTVLERLGFRLEGIMRSYGRMSDGTRIDGAMYAVVSSDAPVADARR